MEKDRIGVSDIIREMRRIVHEAQTDPGSDVTLTTARKIHDWADALEQEMQDLREKVENLQDTFQNGIRVNETTKIIELTWTERQLMKAKENAARLLRELNFLEDK